MCPETITATEDHYHLPQDRLRVVGHASFIGVYPDGYDRDRARSELGVAPDDIVLLALGGIRPYKGIDRLLDALDLALSREPRLRLIVAGKRGVFASAAEIEARCRSHPRVIANFTAIPDDELQIFFKGSDVVALPHRKVLNSGALLLAYTFARPVIAPVTGCLTELLDPACSIGFDPADESSLTSALTRAGTLATHDARIAARAVAESYLPADMAGDFARLLTSLVEPEAG
jgi:glycosyltransferase involved in cell wall biosynthesis